MAGAATGEMRGKVFETSAEKGEKLDGRGQPRGKNVEREGGAGGKAIGGRGNALGVTTAGKAASPGDLDETTEMGTVRQVEDGGSKLHGEWVETRAGEGEAREGAESHMHLYPNREASLPPATRSRANLLPCVQLAMKERSVTKARLSATLSLEPAGLTSWLLGKHLPAEKENIYTSALQLWLEDASFRITEPSLTANRCTSLTTTSLSTTALPEQHEKQVARGISAETTALAPPFEAPVVHPQVSEQENERTEPKEHSLPYAAPAALPPPSVQRQTHAKRRSLSSMAPAVPLARTASVQGEAPAHPKRRRIGGGSVGAGILAEGEKMSHPERNSLLTALAAAMQNVEAMDIAGLLSMVVEEGEASPLSEEDKKGVESTGELSEKEQSKGSSGRRQPAQFPPSLRSIRERLEGGGYDNVSRLQLDLDRLSAALRGGSERHKEGIQVLLTRLTKDVRQIYSRHSEDSLVLASAGKRQRRAGCGPEHEAQELPTSAERAVLRTKLEGERGWVGASETNLAEDEVKGEGTWGLAFYGGTMGTGATRGEMKHEEVRAMLLWSSDHLPGFVPATCPCDAFVDGRHQVVFLGSVEVIPLD